MQMEKKKKKKKKKKLANEHGIVSAHIELVLPTRS
jgi:hypothetical protein